MSLKKYLIAILFTLGFMGLDHSVSATHLFGGEVKYQFLDANGTTPGRPYRYRVTYLIYWNCGTGAAPANPSINVGFYAKSTTPGAPATPIPSISGSFTFNRVFGPPINPPIPAGCTVTISQCVQLIIYEKVVDLPPSIAGYYTIYSVAARNNGIDNLQNSGGENLTLYADMGPTFRFNNSPVFTDTAVAIVCSGDTATIINNATDPDGDRLIYSFNQPYSGSGPNFPPATVDYASGYSVSQPFGAGGYAFLNASTGLTKYYIPNPGEYVVSFEIKEYRNINGVEQLVGTSIRDIQLFVSNQCGSNASPRLSIPATSYNVQAGGSVSFNFKGTDADSLTQPLTFSGELFGPDGLKIQDLPKITSNGTGIYSSINFTAPCKPGIYTYNLRVKDVACPFPKTDPKTILINVLPFKGTKIQGDSVVCNGSVSKYFVTRPAGANIASVNWNISSGTGTITPGATSDTVYVTWTGTGNGTLTSKFLSTANCPDSTNRAVTINQGVAPSFTGLGASYCIGDGSVTLVGNATGGTFSGSGVVTAGTGITTFDPTLAGAGTHTVTYTVLNNACRTTATATVTVTPQPSPDFGALSANSYCLGTAAITAPANSTYSINNGPATQVFDPTTLGVGNYTVQVTTTNGNCSATATKTVAVNAIPTPSLAFLGNTYCANDAAVALDPAQGTYTINGNAASGNFNPATLGAGTYTVMVSKTENNCTGTDSKTVTVNAVPTANFGTLGTTYCKDATPVSLAIAGSTFLVNGAAPVNNEFNPNTLGAGTHTVSVTTTNAQNCSVTASRTITVIEAIPDFGNLTANAYCKDAAAITAPANSTYSIDGGAATTTFNPATLTAGNHTVSVTTMNGTCSATTSKQVTIHAIPAPSLALLANSYCANDAAISLDATQGTYTLNGNALSATTPTFDPSALSPGTHTVVVTKTENNCTGSTTKTITIKPVPAANFGTLATTYCANDAPVSLAITGSTFLVNGVAPAGNQFNPATLGPGTHTVSVTTTSTPDNCSINATRTITVHAIPTPSLAFLNSSYCANSPAVALPGGSNIAYSINGGAFISLATLNPASLTVGSNTIAMRETNANNCTVTTTRSITVNPAPLTDNIAGAISVCPGISGIRYSIINPRETTYQWSLSAGHGTIVSGQGTNSIIVDWGSTAAAATITATPENVHGCLGTPATLPVNITQILATPQPVGPASVCLNQASQLRYVMTNPTTGSTFTWSIPGATINSNTRGDTVLVTFNTAGTHNIVVQESSTGSSATGPVNCFGNSAPFPVTILPSPDATLPIAGPASVCENAGNVAYSLTGAPGTSTYAWTVTHNAVTTPLTGSGSSVQFNATTPGQYTITTTETNAAGCVGTPISKVVTITPRPTLSQIEGPAYICPENLNNQLYYVASTPGQTFNWTVTGGTMVNPGSTNDSIYIDFSNAGTKEITVTPVSGTGCPGTPISMTVILDPATLQLNVATTAVQNDKSIELNLQMPNNSANRKSVDVYRREAGAAGFAKVGTVANTATTFQDNSVQTADKVYEYYLESSNECGTVLKTGVHNTMLLKVTANEAASEVNLRWNSYKGWGQNNLQGYEIYAQADNGGFELIRQVNASDTIVTLSNISARGFNQCFRIKANSTDARASWSNASCVNFENPLAFYNIITPNNDKLNDVFVVENIHLYPGNELKIFNRWGSEVYSKKNYDNTWDGKNTADGTYYYFMKLADGRTYKGWVEIVR